MVQKLLSKRPILVGGLGLATGLGLLGSFQNVFLDGTTLIGVIAAGASVWWWRKQHPSEASTPLKIMVPADREAVEAALGSLQVSLTALKKELVATDSKAAESIVSKLANQRQALLQELDRTTLKVAIAGSPRSGKTTLMGHLQTLVSTSFPDKCVLTEIASVSNASSSEALASQIRSQDAVIYLLTEDVTDSALADLRMLAAAGQRIILGLNKQDNYLPQDQATVLNQVKFRLKAIPQPIDVVAIATAPKPIKVRTYETNSQIKERLEPQAAEFAPIADILKTWLEQDVSQLVTQTVMRQTHQLRRDIQSVLNQVRHNQALPVVEQLQWTAAAAAFANPVPSLDLLAAIAINGQLVMDLGRIYQQPLSFDQAKTIAAELAAIVVKLGIVEVSTQLLTTALKSHATTYLLGGGVQALSAAYLTRLSGESLMTYFEERALSGQAETSLSVEVISQKLQTLLPKTQRTEFLRDLVKQGMQKLTFKPAPTLTSATSPVLDLSETSLAVAATQPDPIHTGEST